MKKFMRGFGSVAFVLAVSVGQLQAALLEYTNRNAWLADSNTATTVAFTGQSDSNTGTLAYDVTANPHVVDDVSFSTANVDNPYIYGYPDQDIAGNQGDYPPAYMGLASGEFLLSYGDLRIDLPSSKTTFGLDLRGFLDANNVIDPDNPPIDSTTTFFFELSNGKTTSVTVTNPASSTDPIPFFGFTDLDTFSWVRISASTASQYIIFDNVSYGETQVPEPSTLAVFGLGALIARSGLARRRRQAQS